MTYKGTMRFVWWYAVFVCLYAASAVVYLVATGEPLALVLCCAAGLVACLGYAALLGVLRSVEKWDAQP